MSERTKVRLLTRHHKGTPYTKKDLQKLENRLLNVFEWDSTPQGGAYWSTVHTNLGGLIAELNDE